MTATVVADASPLIAFQQIGQLNLLQEVFIEVIVPPAVAREIQPSVPPVAWIVQRALAQPIAPLVLRARGAREAGGRLRPAPEGLRRGAGRRELASLLTRLDRQTAGRLRAAAAAEGLGQAFTDQQALGS